MFEHSLRNRLIAAFVGLALLPTLLAGGLLGWHTYTLHLADSYDRQQQMAQRLAVQLGAFLQRFDLRLEDADTLSHFSALRGQEKQRVMSRMLARNAFIREVWYQSADGRERLHVSRVHASFAHASENGAADFFQHALGNGQAYFGPIYYDAASGEPLMNIGRPVTAPLSGKPVGVLALQVRVKAIWEMISDLNLDPGEEVYILDAQQRVIAHRNPSVVLRETRAAIQLGRQRQTGLGGEDAFIATQIAPLGQQSFTVVVERAAKEALIPALTGLKIVGLVTLLALAIALALFYAALRHIVHPIQQVATAARAIRDGDLARRVDVTRDDEVGEMADAFNSMTARLRETLESLRRERDFIQAVMERANTVVVVLDRRGRIVRFNRAAEELTGYAFADVADTPFWEPFLPPEEREAVLAVFEDIKAGQVVSRYENHWLMRDGSRRLFDWSNAVLLNGQGDVDYIVSVGVDITARRQAEDRLAESRQVLRTMIDYAPMWISYFDREGRYIVANRRYAETFGKPVEEIEGARFAEVLPPALALGHAPYVARCLEGELVSFDEAADLGGGEITYTTGTYVPVRGSKGEVIGGVVAVADISELKRTEQALRDLNAHLEERVRQQTEENLLKERLMLQQSRHAAMGEMVSAIAHQWRQPLNALALLLANIHDAFDYGELDQATLEETMATGKKLIQKMSTTIDDFRNFFRLQENPEAFDVGEAIDETVGLVRASLANHDIRLEVAAPPGIQAYGSSNELGQVVLNLIMNAKDACLERAVASPFILVGLSSDGQRATLTVEDNGGGIPPEIAERIFDPYFTTKEMGTGIGLYMARIILEQHMGGEIAFANTPCGVRFTVTFPLTPPRRTGQESSATQSL